MTPEKRKEILLHEANNPNSRYVIGNITYVNYSFEYVIQNPNNDWKIYIKPQERVEYVNMYADSFGTIYSNKQKCREVDIDNERIAIVKRTISCETGDITLEVLPK